MKTLLISLLALLCGCGASAQDTPPASTNGSPVSMRDPTQLSLARIFSDKEFEEEKMEAFQWSKLGAYYFALEKPAGGKDDQNEEASPSGRNLVKHDAASGEATLIASVEQLTAEGAKTPLKIDSLSISKDEQKMLLLTDTKKSVADESARRYWLLDVVTKKLTKLGGEAPEATMMFAKFSPDGTRVAFARQNNLYVQNLADLKVTPLNSDGSDTLINGTTDWVNEEELRLRDGFRWSPDGERLLLWRFDTKNVKRFTLINQTDGPEQQFNTFPYPPTGGTNSEGRLGLVKATGGAGLWLEIPGDPREHYLPQAEWTPDGSAVLLMQLNRLQNTLRVLRADPATGKTSVVLTETDPAWVENKNTFRWIGETSDFLWLSERTGWRHVYRVTPQGEVTALTHGDFDVMDIAAVNAKAGSLDFSASPANATQRYLYRVSLNGGEPARLSPADQPGTHSYELSEDAQWAIHTHSTITAPPVVELVSLPDHRTVRIARSVPLSTRNCMH